MKRLQAIWVIVLLWSTVISALAQKPSWSDVRAKMKTDQGYKLKYAYEGPEGKFFFRYTLQGSGNKILTEVLEGSARGSGTRIYYEPAKDKENVFMETSVITLRRSLGARDIKDSSLYQPLFAQIIGELPAKEPKESLLVPGGLMFVFGDTAEVEARIIVDALGNPTRYRRLEEGKEVKNFVFSELEWGHHSIDWEG